MRKELDEALCAKYPKIFVDRHGDMRNTAMCWGFECGDGWYPIIDALCYLIQWRCDNPPWVNGVKGEPSQVRAVQVKEKFGGLRFYIETAPERVHAYIEMAQQFSFKVCEGCGTTKDVETKGGWIKTLCKACRGPEDGEDDV